MVKSFHEIINGKPTKYGTLINDKATGIIIIEIDETTHKAKKIIQQIKL